jgi:two-component system, sensor histidine kinase PdtaS
MPQILKKYIFCFLTVFICFALHASNKIVNKAEYNSILRKCEKHARTNFDSARYYGFILSNYAIAANDSFCIQDSYHQLGNVYFYANKFDKAIYYFQKAAEINKRVKSNYYLVVDYVDLAFVYLTSGEEGYTQAKHWNDKAKEIAMFAGDSTLAFYYSKSGTFHLKTKNLVTSLHHYKEAYKYYLSHHLEYRDDVLCGIANNIGVVFQKMKLYDSSLVYFNKTYTFPNIAPFNRPLATSIVNTGITMYLMGNYESAIAKTQEGVKELKQFNLTPKILEGYNNLSQCFEKLGRFDSALVYNKKYFTLKDSVFTQATKKQIAEMESRQTLEIRNKEIVEKNFELEKQKNKQQLITWVVVLIGSITLAVFTAFFVIRNKNKLLNKNEIVIKQSLYEKELLLSEVHHRVKNNLQLVSSMLDLQQKYLKDPEAIDAINNSKNRVLSMSLIHQTLYQNGKYGFVDTKDYFERVGNIVISSLKNPTTQVNLVCKIEPLSLLLDYAIPMGLITNELITNACKYAFVNCNEGNITISLARKNELLILKIEDDGIGVDEKKMIDEKSFGLKLIKSLCRQLEANLLIKTHNGSQIIIEISNFKLYEQV